MPYIVVYYAPLSRTGKLIRRYRKPDPAYAHCKQLNLEFGPPTTRPFGFYAVQASKMGKFGKILGDLVHPEPSFGMAYARGRGMRVNELRTF